MMCSWHSKRKKKKKTTESTGKITMMMMLLRLLNFVITLTVLLQNSRVNGYAPLQGVQVKSLTGSTVDIGKWMQDGSSKSMLVFGTYAADFNNIEYAQRLRYYWPKLNQEKGIQKCAFLMNCRPDAAKHLAQLADLPDSIEIWVDNTGSAARAFGVQRGWLPDDKSISPYLKLFGMLWGLGAWATLPSVIGGYIGNPFTPQPWITDALKVGQEHGRCPWLKALTINEDGSARNQFDDLPLVGDWPRRPLELATLRLQSMMGISLEHWEQLKPDDEALQNGVLTQLGGCLIVDETCNPLYEWRDPGICAVANFEDILKKL
jgi:hypothetical protein